VAAGGRALGKFRAWSLLSKVEPEGAPIGQALSEGAPGSRQAGDRGAFLDSIETYRAAVLDPAGYGEEAPVLIRGYSVPTRAVFADSRHVIKYYSAAYAGWASASVMAAEILPNAGVLTPRVLFADTEEKTLKRYGLACVITERIAGRRPDMGETTRSGGPLAPQLARMHALRSARWTPTGAARGNFFPDVWLDGEVMPALRQIRANLSRYQQPQIDKAEAWFRRRSGDLGPAQGGFDFIWGDPNLENQILTDSGDLYLVDFDTGGYKSFGLDLAQTALTMCHPQTAVTHPLHAEGILGMWDEWMGPFLEDYFRSATKDSRNRWLQMRRVAFAFIFLRYYSHRLAAGPEWLPAEGLDSQSALVDTLEARYILDTFMDE
jgi:hypothetical protein